MKYFFTCLLGFILLFSTAHFASAQNLTLDPDTDKLKTTDNDSDGLSEYQELYIYKTDPQKPDTDGDGYTDGAEVRSGYDPNLPTDGSIPPRDKIEKRIEVSLKDQRLNYFLGPYEIDTFLISSGKAPLVTPAGQYQVLKKLPIVNYTGANYSYPKTKWNLQFKLQRAGNLYIHGAYWHNNFGQPMSHGCVNVSYSNMEELYNWADVGTKITIQ